MSNLLLRCCQQQPKHCLWRKRENGCLVVLLSGCLVVLLSGCFVVLLFCCLVVLLSGYFVVLLFCCFVVWKTIPSEARVTRDEVSGL